MKRDEQVGELGPFTLALGLMTEKDIVPGKGSVSCHGQGAVGKWRDDPRARGDAVRRPRRRHAARAPRAPGSLVVGATARARAHGARRRAGLARARRPLRAHAARPRRAPGRRERGERPLRRRLRPRRRPELREEPVPARQPRDPDRARSRAAACGRSRPAASAWAPRAGSRSNAFHPGHVVLALGATRLRARLVLHRAAAVASPITARASR